MKYPQILLLFTTLSCLTAIKAPQADVPDGTFRKSCLDCSTDGQMLTCTCPDSQNPDANQHWYRTQLQMDPAKSFLDIANVDGSLVYQPVGPYSQDCIQCTLQGTTLQCNCPDSHRTGHTTSLVLDPAEHQPIINCDGSLQYLAPLPEGTYKQSCEKCSLTCSKGKQQLECECSYKNWFGHTTKRVSKLTLDAAKRGQNVANCEGHLKYGDCK